MMVIESLFSGIYSPGSSQKLRITSVFKWEPYFYVSNKMYSSKLRYHIVVSAPNHAWCTTVEKVEIVMLK